MLKNIKIIIFIGFIKRIDVQCLFLNRYPFRNTESAVTLLSDQTYGFHIVDDKTAEKIPQTHIEYLGGGL